jgi:hypothetical protein
MRKYGGLPMSAVTFAVGLAGRWNRKTDVTKK